MARAPRYLAETRPATATPEQFCAAPPHALNIARASSCAAAVRAISNIEDRAPTTRGRGGGQDVGAVVGRWLRERRDRSWVVRRVVRRTRHRGHPRGDH